MMNTSSPLSRKERTMQTEFPSAEEKAAFFTFCHNHGQVPSKVVRILIKMYMEGKIKF